MQKTSGLMAEDLLCWKNVCGAYCAHCVCVCVCMRCPFFSTNSWASFLDFNFVFVNVFRRFSQTQTTAHNYIIIISSENYVNQHIKIVAVHIEWRETLHYYESYNLPPYLHTHDTIIKTVIKALKNNFI